MFDQGVHPRLRRRRHQHWLVCRQTAVPYVRGGLDYRGSVRQIEVMDCRERHGCEFRNPEWRRYFVGKRSENLLKRDVEISTMAVRPLLWVAVGQGTQKRDHLIDLAWR